ncbi:polysaccharide biosynthesis/export family protein [Sphingomonas sp. CROZ-RG-20F-R02-07]|uniref:polysaccharide biosynthesis/export family protein n=1 Tax=Sphingomonas sp. CROZ-RG-20F-R02-07 TaxID=2914832 RepID=UPI001F567B3D|nr:polysaccharide biosynthesis/export family protein [Sphingomonas sp. CROZ-RG-20F-R02-07]
MAVLSILILANPAIARDKTIKVATAEPNGPGLPTYSYTLSGGDKIRLIVFGETGIGGDYTVSGSGLVAIPLIGDVEAKGLTSTQLQQRIAAKLADGYIKEPRVAVEVLTTRPFYILGEVNRPGEYPFSDGMTVATAVAQAGGYTYRAKTGRVLIKHAGETDAHIYPLTSATAVAPGDTIQIKERWF